MIILEKTPPTLNTKPATRRTTPETAKAMIKALLLQQPQHPRFDVMTETSSGSPNAKATLEGAERLELFLTTCDDVQHDPPDDSLVTRFFQPFSISFRKRAGSGDEIEPFSPHAP